MKGHNYGICQKCKKYHEVPDRSLRKKQMLENNPAKRIEVRTKISDTLKRKYKEGIIKSGFIEYNKNHKEDIRKRMIENNPCKYIKRRRTKIELKMEKYLKELNMDFTAQYITTDKFVFDFYIPKYNLGIECDGMYWHNYPNYTEVDKRKHNFCLKNNIFLLRCWDETIKNEEETKQLILNIINHIEYHIGEENGSN